MQRNTENAPVELLCFSSAGLCISTPLRQRSLHKQLLKVDQSLSWKFRSLRDDCNEESLRNLLINRDLLDPQIAQNNKDR